MTMRRLQVGFALPAVIFLMVIVALLIAYMARLMSVETAAVNLNLLSTRAYWAAQAANEWAAYEIKQNHACPTVPSNFVINGFSMAVNCAATPYTEGANNGSIYQVDSRAVYGSSPASPDYVSRHVEMVLDDQ